MPTKPLADLLDLSGQVAIVTGASRGIGKSIAEFFHQAGASLTLVARNAGPLEAVAETLSASGDVLAVPADVADETQINAITPGVIETSFQIPPESRSRINELIPMGYIGQLEEITYAVLFLASRMGAYITGATIDVNGGLLKR